MSVRADDPGPVFAGAEIDRLSAERHDVAFLARAAADPDARLVLATEDGVAVDRAAGALRRVALREWDGEPPWLLLGLEQDAPLWGVLLPEGDAPSPVLSLREAGATLSRSEGGLAASLVGLLNWHGSHGFCPACGARSEVAQAGYARRCTRCHTSMFPRTDPAVIMLVSDGQRVLLGRRAAWPERRYSILAGFVSPGESLEEAVVREVAEESGIVATEPRFVASQPWPFPASLMLGFTARARGGDPFSRDGELADVRWFSREEVLAALRGDQGPLAMPPSISIAYMLIRMWAIGELVA